MSIRLLRKPNALPFPISEPLAVVEDRFKIATSLLPYRAAFGVRGLVFETIIQVRATDGAIPERVWRLDVTLKAVDGVEGPIYAEFLIFTLQALTTSATLVLVQRFTLAPALAFGELTNYVWIEPAEDPVDHTEILPGIDDDDYERDDETLPHLIGLKYSEEEVVYQGQLVEELAQALQSATAEASVATGGSVVELEKISDVGRPRGHGETILRVMEGIRDGHKQGLSDGQIATRVGRTRAQVAELRKEMKLPANHKPGGRRAQIDGVA